MRKLNAAEKELELLINETKYHVDRGVLEIDFIEEDGRVAGWYAQQYIDGYGAIPMSESKYNNIPLIAEANVVYKDVDVYRIFKRCRVAYCE
jgi:hypothetical protein